jgi:hypothetical protein
MARHSLARRIALGGAVALATLASTALGLSVSMPVHATVDGHVFHHVRIESQACELKVELRFDAPAARYQSRAKDRNYYRFLSQLTFDNGKAVVTHVFGNSGPGERVYRTHYDTGPEGCWAKKKVKFRDFDVVGCRGHGCRLANFAR